MIKTFKNFQIRWGEWVGEENCLYLRRWIFLAFGYAIRIHYWTHSDDQRYFHDHPWWMIVYVLRGSYQDISPKGIDTLTTGSIRIREPEHKHTVKLLETPTITLLFTGPKVRHWGFWIPGRNRILRPLRYFQRYGHHQCEDYNEK